MKTNTIHQAKQLKQLKIKQKELPFEMYGMQGWWQDKSNGPCLGLDLLHDVFEWLHNECICSMSFSETYKGEKTWFVRIGDSDIEPDRTTNHAQDWAEILIWLLKNGHVSAELVNGVINAK